MSPNQTKHDQKAGDHKTTGTHAKPGEKSQSGTQHKTADPKQNQSGTHKK